MTGQSQLIKIVAYSSGWENEGMGERLRRRTEWAAIHLIPAQQAPVEIAIRRLGRVHARAFATSLGHGKTGANSPHVGTNEKARMVRERRTEFISLVRVGIYGPE
jgi:hypothetical protein